MSNATKWILAVIIIIAVIVGLRWNGYLGGSASETGDAQGAAVLNTAGNKAAPIDSSDTKIAEESAAIDVQMKVSGNQLAAWNQAPTVAKGNLVVAQLGTVATLMNTLASRFQSRVSILKSAGFNTNTIQGAVSDMSLQTSYAASQIGLVGEILAQIKTGAAGSTQTNQNNASISQAKIELQKAQDYLVAAGKNIKTVIDGFKTISTSQGSR